jgi:predicted DNA-binding ribbon-helix-helix protein
MKEMTHPEGYRCVEHHEKMHFGMELLQGNLESAVRGGGVGVYGGLMKSSVIKRSIVIDGHKTSVSHEDAFWDNLKKIAHARQVTLSELVTKIDLTREQGNLSSAIRLFVLQRFRNEDKQTEEAERTSASA